MGLLGTVVTYKFGKSRGAKAERKRARSQKQDTRNPDCINYQSFCKNYGSCGGQRCEY
jgi:hypothetical protein